MQVQFRASTVASEKHKFWPLRYSTITMLQYYSFRGQKIDSCVFSTAWPPSPSSRKRAPTLYFVFEMLTFHRNVPNNNHPYYSTVGGGATRGWRKFGGLSTVVRLLFLPCLDDITVLVATCSAQKRCAKSNLTAKEILKNWDRSLEATRRPA